MPRPKARELVRPDPEAERIDGADAGQLEQSQRQLNEMRQQLGALQRQMAERGSTMTTPTSTSSTSESSSTVAQAISPATNAAIDDLCERQAMQASQIATHEQTKVESESKYPVKITGLLLLNGFVNTRQVDIPAAPTVQLRARTARGPLCGRRCSALTRALHICLERAVMST
jgi:hypothetical protein